MTGSRCAKPGMKLCIQLCMHARAFLGRQTGQVQRFKRLRIGLFGIQAAGQQNFVDELVQLGDAARNLHALRGAAVQRRELQAHADAGQRRAQLMRCIGQQ